MQLRRFTGDSTTKTLEEVRAAFGDEAIILSNRSVDGRVEIIATGTLDERELAAAAPAEAAVTPTAAAVRGVATPTGVEPSASARPAPEPGVPAITPWTPTVIAPFAEEAEARDRDGGAASSIDALSRDLAALSTEDAVPLTLGAVPDTLCEPGGAATALTAAVDATAIADPSAATAWGRHGSGVAAPADGGRGAAERAEVERAASGESSPDRPLPGRVSPERIVSERVAPSRVAPDREGAMRVAPVRVVPMPNAPDRGAPDRSGPAIGRATGAGTVPEAAPGSRVPASGAPLASPPDAAVGDAAAPEASSVAAPDPVPTAAPAEEGAAGAPATGLERVLVASERRHERRTARLETRLRRLEVNLWGEIEPLKAAHLRQLLKLGIGAELAIRLVERIAPGSDAERAMRRSLALLKSTLPVGVDETGRQPGVTVLSGPAGGGKTTSLIKLAAAQVRREGAQSLVMIAADNRRIGAFEALQVYGRLLGVPVVQARDAEELASLVAAFTHKSLVLVDNLPPGSGERLLPSLRAALGQSDGVPRTLRHLLVLPAILESRAFEGQVAEHAARGVTHAVLTQLDRSARLGTCFAPLVRHRLPIGYWSDNARVQTPLERADASVLVATAMATGGRVAASADEECLLSLLQPTRRDVAEPVSVDAACADAAGTGAARAAVSGGDGSGAIPNGAEGASADVAGGRPGGADTLAAPRGATAEGGVAHHLDGESGRAAPPPSVRADAAPYGAFAAIGEEA